MNNMDRTLFQGFWHGPPLGLLRRSCLSSFVKCGHRFHLYVYGPIDVPAGIELKNANDVIPEQEVLYFKNPVTGQADLGPFSDLFRFKLLMMYGGWWSDVDTLCLSAHIPSVDRAWARECPEHNPGAVGTSQISFKPGDEIARELYERCYARARMSFTRREALGPLLISSTIAELGLPLDNFGSADSFYPVRWIETFKLWLPEFRKEVEDKARKALFMPIYQSFSQYIGIDFTRLPPEESFLGVFCNQFIKHGAPMSRYDAESIRQGTRQYILKHKGWAINELISVSGPDVLGKLGIKHGDVPFFVEDEGSSVTGG